MYWRVLVAFSVLTIFLFVEQQWGITAGFAATSACMVVMMPLGEIERRLTEIRDGMKDDEKEGKKRDEA